MGKKTVFLPGLLLAGNNPGRSPEREELTSDHG